MALNKEKVQDLIDDFVVNNVDQINEVGYENPVLYDAVIDALNLLSRKFGTIQAINIPKPAAPTEPEKPRENALHPSVQIGATFGEAAAIERKYEVEMINFGEELVTFLYNDSHNSIRPIQVKFSRVNKAIEEGEFKLVQKTQLNPKIFLGAKLLDRRTTREYEFIISNIDYVTETLQQTNTTSGNILDFSFNDANDKIKFNTWVDVTKTQPQAPKLNSLVDIGEVFEKTNGDIITITDIDPDKDVVEYESSIMGPNTFASFKVVNDFIDQKVWVNKTPVIQSNTFGALTLNPSVQVGQLYIDLEDDSNFSVLLIDQKKQVVTINWNEDDIQADVDFEDFNDNLQAATWVLAPDQAQGAATEAEILEAIEGLELIDDAESKKEIAELKKQLKQLKKKKP